MSSSVCRQLIFLRCLRTTSLLRQWMSSTSNDKFIDNKTQGSVSVADVGDGKSETDPPKKVGGLAVAFEKFEKIKRGELDADEDESFASMMRKCKLMQIGEPRGRTVVGTIFDVVEDDLYIDFGGKFHCICPRPNFQPKRFHEGVRVKLQLNDMEMSSSFLGSDKHITLLEADSTLLGLHSSEKWKVS